MPSVAPGAEVSVILGGESVVVSVEDGNHPRKLLPPAHPLAPIGPRVEKQSLSRRAVGQARRTISFLAKLR
jgi:hypothetical protein